MKTFTKLLKYQKLILVATLLISAYSHAQLQQLFSARYSEDVNGDITIIANNTVSVHQSNNYTGTSNNDLLGNLVYVDIDGFVDADNNSVDDTFNSSSANFSNPAPTASCLTIKKVLLYWAASDKENDDGTDNQPNWPFDDIKLMLPGQVNYIDYDADDIIYRGRDSHFSNDPYICVKDITTEVNALTSGPYGSYQVANVEGQTGNLTEHDDPTGFPTGVSGGWQIVFVYESPNLQAKNINIYDGYAHIISGGTPEDIDFSGFQTLPAGAVNAKIVVGALEGDRRWNNDKLQIQNTTGGFTDLFANPVRDANNFFNSRITVNNSDFVDRSPASTNTLGFDAAVFDMDNPSNTIIGNSQNSAKFRISTASDTYGVFLVGLAIDIWKPDLGPISVTLNSPGTPDPGDIINAQFNVANKGNDNAKNLRIFENLPPQLISTLPPTATPLPHPTVAGVTYQYDASTNLLEFFVDDSLVTAGSTSFNVDFDLQIRDACYFLETNCDLQFDVQFEATYNGEINTQQQLTRSSATEDPCSVSGVKDPLVINVNKPTVDWQTTIGILDRTIQCNDSAGLISAQALEPAANKCTFTPIKNSGSFIPDAGCPSSGTYTNTWNFTDACGVPISDFVQTITVINTTSISLPSDGASTVDCIADATETFTLPTVTDACGNTLTPSAAVITENPNPLTCEGTRTYTYTYTDCANNSDTWAYVYTIDTPAFTIAATDGTSTVDCRNDATSSGVIFPTVIDACNNTLTPSAPIITFNPDPLTCEGTRTYTYTYTDCAGNSDTWDFIYTIDTPDFTIAAADGASTVDCIADADGLAIVLPTITNVCGSTLTPSAAVITENPDPLTCEGTRTYTYTYTDCADNSDTWAYVYTIDTPTFTIAATDGASTVDCIADATETFTLPAVTDVCGNTLTPSAAVITENPNPLTCEGTRTYTYTYTDCANNSDTWAYVYTIDTPAFTIATTDGASTVDCIADATETFTLPAVTDVCGNTLTPSAAVITENPNPLTCEGTRTYTYTYTDCADNSDTWAYVYTIDTPAFTIATTDGASTVDCIADATQPTAPVVTDVCGNDITPVITENTDPICEGDKIYTFTYTDCAGNASVYVYTYTIDLTPFILPSNGVETVDNLADAIAPTPPTVTDNCGNAITPSAPTVSATPVCQGSIVYTFTYIDCAGNSADWAYTYTIELAPFTVPASDGTTVECIADATAPIPPVVVDANGDDVIPVMTENTDPICEGDKIYTFTYTDCAGNAGVWEYTYTIDVTTAPVVPTNAGSIVECIADATQPTAPVVTDVCGNDITPVITENTDPICEGDKIYTFTYTDCAGNASVFVYTYTIDVTTAPVVPTNAGSTVECIADATQPTAPVVTDVCGNDITPVITENTDPICEGDKIYTFTYTDCAGNASVFVYTYTIDVTTAPVVPTNAGSTIECIADATQPNAPVVTDVCGNDITPVITENTDPICEGDKIYTFTYTDCAGNASVYVYTYTIDLTPFILPINGVETVDNLADAIAPTPPTVTDNCGNAITPSAPTVSATPVCQGSIVYTFTYIDCAGNSADWAYTYTIELAPFTVPASDGTTVECIADATAPIPPVVVDANGDDVIPVMTENTDPICEGDKIYTFTYTDCAGNAGVWEYTYTIDVTTAPVVPTNAGSIVECIADATQPTAPVVTDVCGNDITPVITENTDPICEGDKIYTFTYTDCAGNASVFVYTYTIDVTTAPVVPTNAGSTVECIADATQPTAPVVTDVCGNDITPVITENTDPICEGDKIYTFTYTDCAGNASVFVYTYTIDVTTAPVVPTNAGSTIECIADATQPNAPVVTDVCGNDITPVITENTDPICEGDKIYTFTYTDCAGNASVFVYTYTIDLTPFILPINGVETVDNLADAIAPTPPTVTDNCGNAITPSAPTVSATPVCQGSIVYTFTYIDCAGNSADWAYTYTIELAPFTVPASDGTTVECIADATAPIPPVVVDANGDDVIPVMTENTDPICEGDKIYTFTYTDCAGNAGVWEYTYTIDVTTAPVVPTNAGSIVECIADATQPTAPVVTDVCGNDITPVITENTDPICEGDKIYTFTYTDCAGNASVFVYTYTIDVTTAPVVPTNAGSIVECIADATQPTAPVVTDVCGNDITPVITENTDPICEGDKIYTFTYTDCAGNASVFVYTYTIDVTTAPVVPTNAGSTVECIADATQPTAPVVTDVCGNDITPVITENTDPICEGDKIYTFTYTDCAGNASVYVYTYTIDLTPFILPSNGVETVDNLADAIAPTPPTVTDNCGNAITPSAPTVSATPVCQGSIVYTFTYIDCAGNSADWAYTYTIELAPFTVPASDGTTVECIADATAPIPPVVVDANGDDVIPIMTENTDPICEGDKIYTFTYSDCAGNAGVWEYTYTIDVTTAPVVPTNAGSTVECIADATQPTAPVVTDVCGNDITPVITENTDPICEGDKIYTFTYTDCAGNASVFVYTYTIDVTTAPVVPTNAGSTVECIADATQPTAPVVTDVCGNDITPVITENTDPICEGDKIYTFTYTDCAGNASVYVYTYTIDLTPFILPSNGVETVDNLADAIAPTPPTVTDNCGNAITPSAPTVSATPVCQGSIVYTFTYIDCAGNSADWAYTYTIELAPFTVPASDGTTVECIADATAPIPPVVVDANGDDVIPIMTENTDPICEGDKIYTFTYSDCAGNAGVWEYTYTIDVTTAPVVPTNAGSTVECIADATQPTAPVVTDVCGNDITPVITENTDPICEGDKIYTFTYTDCAGNASVFVYTYTIDVTTAPVVPTNAGSTVECIADATQPTAPVVTDVCGNDITPVITENTDPICEGDKIYTFTYTDCAGNASVFVYTYTIDVTTAPVVPTNAGSTVECIADATQPTAPVVTDVCGNDITPVITENTDPICEGDKIYTFTYTDCAGNASVFVYTYTIDVTTAPVVPTNAGSTVECIADATQPTAPVVTDVCGNDITPVITENTDPICEGDKIYTFTYTDCAGNASVFVYTYTIDVTTAPVVPTNAGSAVECIADATQPTAPVVTDVCGNDITPVITENVDPICEGDKIYTFTYTDCAGNAGVWEYTYTIDVTNAPVVPTNAGSTVECIADATQPTAPVVTDVCGNDITPVITENTDPICEGDKIYTFTYTDCAGNASVFVYTYTIDVTTAPVVPTNAGSTVECIADATQPTAPVVTDVCGNDITPVITENTDPICEGDKIYTFTYTDCAGNASVYVYTYTIDLTPFILPSNGVETVDNLADAIAPTPPTVTDNCGNAITPSAPTVSATPVCQGSIVYTFTYIDCAGNSADWAYTYTIELAPFTVPASDGTTVECIADATAPIPPVVVDANGDDVIPIMTENTDPICEGDKIYTFTYSDCAGNAGVWEYTYTIDVTTAPVVPTNAGSTVECIADATQPTAPVVTDVCGNDITPVITENTDPICEGDKIYTFTYTDCAGNASVFVYTYTIDVTTAPVVPTNAGSTVECIADATQPTAPVVTDVCGNDITPVITENTDPICEGDKIYTFTYTDCAGNASVFVYTYTIDVTTAPVVPTNAGSTVECIADATQPTAPVVTDVCGNDITPVITENTDPICEGDKIYTFTYTDCAGNASVFVYTYTIDVTTAPVVPTNAGSTVECIADATQPTAPVVTDVCGNDITPVITENTDPICEGDKIYTFTYTDCAGNASVFVYTYTIDVTTAPVVPTNAGSAVECIADATQPTAPVVTDVCGNDITPVITENTDPICEGDKIYTFTYTDCAGNASVFVYTYTIDVTTAPVVPTNAGSTVECIADATQPTAPVVTDVCGNDITPVITENTDPICEGDKIYTFTYTDCAGNASVFVYTYTIDVTTAPVVPTNAGSTVECIADATQPTAPVVTDVCGNDITPVITENTDPICEGDKIYTFTYTDCAGNASVFVYTYTIDVTTAPVVPTNAGSAVECIADATQPTAPVVTDVCGNDITPVITENVDPICEGDKIYTFTYTDCAGNASVFVYTYTIDVTTAPVVPTNAGSAVECIADATQPTAPVVTDVCGNDITPVITENVDPICEGDKIYTFTYTDCAGNASVFVYTYTVKDTTPPVLSLPANISAECSDDLSPINFGMATATDNCDSDPIITFNDVRIDGDCPGTYTITRTWTATDNCGNSIDKDQLIELSDTTAPEFDQTTLPANTVVECDNIPEEEVLTASDNCGTASVTVNDERVDGNCPNSYEIKRSYTATDECGLTTTHVQTITVQDTTPPVFVETLPNTRIVAQCDAIPVPETLTATDICGSATVSVSDARTDGNCPNSYTLARTWVATDECGLTTTHTQIIIVQDTTPPVFVEALPRDATVECDSIPDTSTLTATDNCGDATVSVSDSRIDGNCPSNYTIVRTWIAIDECGLTTTHVQTITVQDTTAPTPTSSFEATLDVSCAFIPEAPEVEFTDNCSSNVIIDFNETNTFDESVIADYQIIRTWTVRDACNNEAVYSQTLNVALDEILNEVVAEDICFDNGVVNLDNFLADDVYGGIWEIVEGNPIATVNGSIFDPTNLEAAYSESFNPNTDGIQYVLRYTGFQTGCINITDVVMIVDASCKVLPCGEKDISISTAITPNGDDFNKTFDIEGITLCGFVAEVKIFNRWGALVYESNEYTLGSEREGNAFGAFGKWDGSSTKSSFGNNGKLPNGTYYYIINLRNSGLDPITGPVYLGTK